MTRSGRGEETVTIGRQAEIGAQAEIGGQAGTDLNGEEIGGVGRGVRATGAETGVETVIDLDDHPRTKEGNLGTKRHKRTVIVEKRKKKMRLKMMKQLQWRTVLSQRKMEMTKRSRRMIKQMVRKVLPQ